ncbi:trans-aconitate methyltransferase [Paenibacillus methanolicus]|uniref:Trans-aconitate methyltransferase n=1 Tax=Paenibacillus methanolicus TaxID=582686 RepID=A0A5S5CL68_9BACL|nr:trans-aconitate methyltransferase [Paenibacillus methanolicus]
MTFWDIRSYYRYIKSVIQFSHPSVHIINERVAKETDTLSNETNRSYRNSYDSEIKLDIGDAGEHTILSLLEPREGERILDLGCGTGRLTAAIAASGAMTLGIDSSEAQIEKARLTYPELRFQAADACHYEAEKRFDAVFSHAAIHWIPDTEAVVRTIGRALAPGGRFVAEFAGSGNVAALTDSIERALADHGYAPAGRIPWYLPTIGEFAGLLERNGFRVTLAQHFDRLRPFNHPDGIKRWLEGFDAIFFADVTPSDKASIYRSVEMDAATALRKDGQWYNDISRIRVIAFKQHAN